MANVELRSLRVSPEIDASKYTAGAQQKIAADKAMVAANQEVAATAAQTDVKVSQSGDVLARLSRQYVDGYAAAQRFNSALNSLSRGIEANRISLAEAGPILDGIYKKYGMMAEASQFAAKGQVELAAAITAANAKVAAQRQLSPANANQPNNFAALNATSQFQDIAITAAMGQSLLTIALQQGPQLGAGLQMALGEQGAAGAAKVLGSAILGLFSPINLVAIGLTAVVAAGIQFGAKLFPQVKSLDDLFKQQTETVKALGDAYGDVAKKADGAFGGGNQRAFGIGAANTVNGLRLGIARETQTSLGDILINRGGGASGNQFGPSQVVSTEFSQFSDAIDYLRKTAREGQPDVLGFRKMVEDRWALDPNNQALTDAAGKLKDLTEKAGEAERQLKQLQIIQRELFNNVGPNGFLLSQGTTNRDDMGNLSLYESQQRIAAARARQAFDAQTQSSLARSPQELAAAARAQAQATYVASESSEERNLRVDLAGKRALTDAENALKQAQIDRYRAIDQAAASQQLELDLIGKTTGEATKMRFEFERIQQLREDAARNHTVVDQAEVDRIKAAAEAAGQLADAVARANLSRDLQFERDQILRSPNDQAIASRLNGAGLPVDLDSPLAQQMRANQNLQEARDAASGFVKTFGDELINNGGDIGKALGKAILNSLMDATQKAWEQLANQVGNALASALFGGSASATGGVASSAVSGGAGIVGSLFSGAAGNDNYAPGAVTRMALPAVGATGYSVGGATNFIKQYASAIGIDPDIALRVARSEGLGEGLWQSNFTRNGFREPSFGPFQLLKGGPGTGFGPGLGNKFMAQTGLDPADPANWQQSTAFALDQAKANGWGAWYGAKGQGITGFMGIDQSATKAVSAIDNLASSSTKTADSLTSGLGKLGDTISGNAASAIPGASASGSSGGGLGDIFSWIGSLFGFANGTEGAPPGWAWVGERGPELRKLRAGDVIRDSQRSAQMAAANANVGPPGKTELHVHVHGGSGDDHIRKLARQGAQQAIADNESAQRRGGFGTTQRRYSNNKN